MNVPRDGALHPGPDLAPAAAGRDVPDAGDEQALVERARTGHDDAFEELVRRYRNDVFSLAYRYVHNREEAWDLSQDVFVKAHRSLRRFRGDAKFKTWLLRITANHSKDFLKKRRLDTVPYNDALEAPGAASVAGPDRAYEAQELGQLIQAALDTLSHKHRTAFVLREFEGLSYEEMAGVMGCSVGTVMSRLHHARRKLRNRLTRMGVAQGAHDE
ncbi:MAG: sigma-70 family RNA polymerase sigma factor [Candidatus Hydrogenedentes bacterium]|nr:sigma-70 family RNA polymerase sigma factor [Candidatus Hydrogenedentota bacterium]